MRLARIISLVVFWLGIALPFCAYGQSVKRQVSLADLSESLQQISAEISPAVVQILASGYAPESVNPQGQGLIVRQRSNGSGVIIDPSGYCMTNYHVVRGSQQIRVKLALPPEGVPEGSSILKARGKILDAELVGVDPETDLAVLSFAGEDLPHLELGDSDALQQGQLVLAFGSPLGLDNSVSLGIVSAVARQFPERESMVYIQTDASINPGNSGGPLVDSQGRMVGINTMILSQSGGAEGLGFAVPSNIVKTVYEQIRRHGRVRRGVIGAVAETITPTLAEALELPREWGVVLSDVLPGSPADQAGLKIGDLVLSLDGKVMENGRQFDVNLYQRSVGELVELRALRNDQERSFRVRVMERSDDVNRFREMVDPQENLISDLGILGMTVGPAIQQMIPSLRTKAGVLVAALSSQALYLESQLRPGDVIFAVNGNPILDLNGLREAIRDFRRGDPIALHIERQGKYIYLGFNWE